MIKSVALQFVPVIISPPVASLTKLTALDAISHTLASASGKSIRQINTAFLKRERLGNTALEAGVVIPHAVLEDRQPPILGILCWPQGVKDWRDLEDQKVRLIMAILIGQTDLTAEVAAAVKKLYQTLALPEFLALLSQASQPQIVIERIRTKLEE